MSEFRKIVEAVLTEMLPSSYDYWRTTNPDYEEEGAYEDWLEQQEPEAIKYAVFIEKDPKFGKTYVDVNSNDGERTLTINNELTTEYEPETKCLWDTEEEAKQIASEYNQIHTDKSATPVKVYTKDLEHWSDDAQDIWTWEDWKNEQAGY